MLRSGIYGSIALGLWLVAGGCASEPPEAGTPGVDVAELEAELLEADRAFAAATAELRLEGWLQYFTEDAARVDLHGDIARGLEAIARVDGPVFADPDVDLRWEPSHAGLFAGGDLGYTKGEYRLVRAADGGERLLGEGSYLSLWRREAGGWRVILDTGAPKPAPEGG